MSPWYLVVLDGAEAALLIKGLGDHCKSCRLSWLELSPELLDLSDLP